VPAHLVDHDVRRREIVVLAVSKLDFSRDVIVLRRTESVLSPGAEAFLAHLIEFIQHRTKT
jgi:DNA-binding transcriptional LysR family regulator